MVQLYHVIFVYMTTTHGRAILLCMKFLLHGKMAAECEMLRILTLEETEAIISEAKPTNTKRVTACSVFVYSFVFLLVKFNDFNTAVEVHIHLF